MPIDPMLLNFPSQFYSERLLIRAPQAGDGVATNQAIQETFDDLHTWMDWARAMPTIEETELHIRQSAARFIRREELQLLLYHRTTGDFVGSSGLHSMDWFVPAFEIGYWVRKSYAGQGYITEAVLAIVSFAFQFLMAERLEIRCDTRNHRSAAVAKRAGFAHEATLHREARSPQGDLRDTYVFARLRHPDDDLAIIQV